MMMNKDKIKWMATLLLLGVAAYCSVRFWWQSSGSSEKAFFYNLSERKLFAGPRSSVPPIQGLKHQGETAVRAVVISTNGNPGDKSSWQIAYLEKYSPELKMQMETAQSTGTAPVINRAEAQSHRFVRRVAEAEWHPLSSTEGEQIVNEWLSAGPGGAPAVICTP
jgi:hypothetical protein